MRKAVELQAVPLPDESCNKPSCRFEYWSLRVSPFPHDRGPIALTGRVFGHPEVANGTEIVTSRGAFPLRARSTGGVYS